MANTITVKKKKSKINRSSNRGEEDTFDKWRI